MDVEQIVKIPLKEYLELKEIKDHAKEVKIEETYTYNHGHKDYDHQGITVYWKSDGACWVHLSSKLSKQGRLVKYLIKEKKELEEEIEGMKIRGLLKKLISKDKEV